MSLSLSDSILDSTKKLLGIDEDYRDFDLDIMTHINSTFLILRQLGIGPDEGYIITDRNDKWSDFLTDVSKLAAVKTYIAAKVRLIFDPPVGGALDALKSVIAEFEWRLNVEVDPGGR